MNSILSFLANPFFVKLALNLLEAYAQEQGIDSQEEQIFIQMASTLQKLGAKEAISRFQTGAQQDSDLDQAWKKEKDQGSKQGGSDVGKY